MCECFKKLNPNGFFYEETVNTWYILNEFNIWEIDQGSSAVVRSISNLMSAALKKEFEILKDTENDIDDLYERYSIYLRYIQTTTKITGMVKYLQHLYSIKIFEKLDTINPYLFPFTNGVYDFKENKFRLPFPEEYITITCGYEYKPEKEVRDTKKKIYDLLNSMQKNSQDTDFLIKTVAQCVCMEGHLEHIYCWLGQGGNGKGVYSDLISGTFGKLFGTMSINYFNTNKLGESATSADPVMAGLKNARIVLPTEIDPTTVLKTGILKQISGKGEISCRGLYQSNFTFSPKFMFFFQSNYNPILQEASETCIRRRFYIVPFPFNFKEKPNPANPNEKQMDGTIKNKISSYEYKIAFFHLLKEHYLEIQNNPESFSQIPKNIKKATDLFHCENDPVTPFVENCIIKTDDNRDYVKSSVLFEAFIKFNKTNHKINNSAFKTAMQRCGYETVRLKGYPIYRNIKLSLEKEELDVEFLDE
jgi:putative DNA primase/helicase